MAKKKTPLEVIEKQGDEAIARLNNVNLSELPAHAAAEQVRATYLLTQTLERINETLGVIIEALPMAGKGF